jgi:hypothetical protein
MKIILLCAVLLFCLPTGAQNSTQLAPGIARIRGLPTVEQVQKPERFLLAKIPDAVYRVGKASLVCTLPNGSQVSIALVDDPADFTFLATRSPYGPAILANDRQARNENQQYAIFSFYRECGLHVLTKVSATTPENADIYSLDILKAAECLAVIPSQQAMTAGQSLSVSSISTRLKAEYGARIGSSRQELTRCGDMKFVKELATRQLSRP